MLIYFDLHELVVKIDEIAMNTLLGLKIGHFYNSSIIIVNWQWKCVRYS